MKTVGLVYKNIECLVTNEGLSKKLGIRPQEKDLGLISKAALVWSHTKGVAWVGSTKDIPRHFRLKDYKTVDCKGLTAYPGLVDCHTHPVFAGDRSREFELRMTGVSYQEIAKAGGGIANSVQATRAASVTALSSLLDRRLSTFSKFGVRLLEAKSGYGLDFSSEIKSLSLLRKNKNKSIKIVPTCLSAHSIPPEFKQNRERYLYLLEDKIFSKVAKEKLADYVDVFCDEGYFTLKETERLLLRAQQLGLHTRLHGEELAFTGAASLAARMGAHSVDHLLKIDDQGIKDLAASETVAVLLPATGFYLREKPAPARKLIAAGAKVALATDFNPGSSPTQSLPFVGTLAAVQLGLTTAEIISAVTWVAARSLRKENTFGALLPGYMGKPAFAYGDHPSSLFYSLAPAGLPDPEIDTK